MTHCACRRGFTLIEVLIVIAVIAILASIVVPRLMGAGREAREASLKAHLHELRMTVNLSEAHCGDHPSQLADIMAASAPASGGTGVGIIADDYRGPYLTTPDMALPKNPITGGNTEGTDWLYVKMSGRIRAKAGTARDGTNYIGW